MHYDMRMRLSDCAVRCSALRHMLQGNRCLALAGDLGHCGHLHRHCTDSQDVPVPAVYYISECPSWFTLLTGIQNVNNVII